MVLGASITKDRDLFKGQIIFDPTYRMEDILVLIAEETEILRAFERGTGMKKLGREIGETEKRRGIAIETETGIGRERRTRTRIGIELKRERRIGRRIEIERGTDGERQIKAAAAKKTTSTRERPPLVQKKAAVKTVRTSIRKIAMTIAV